MLLYTSTFKFMSKHYILLSENHLENKNIEEKL